MGTLVEETKKVDMEMPEKEEKQTYSVSFEPQQQISPELSEGDTIQQKEGESFRMEPISFPVPYRVRRPRLGEKTCHVVIERSIWDSRLEPISFSIPRRARRPRLGEKTCHVVIESSEPPSVSVKSDSSMNNPPSVDPQKTQSAPLHPSVSVKSDLPDSDLQKTQRESLSETDSTDTGVSVRSDSSMIEPFSFNPQKKQSCAVCEEAVKDPVLLPCGHWSCKQCSHSFWDECGDSDSCKKCGRRSEREKRDPDLQSVLLEKMIKRVEMETEKLQAEKETFQAEKEKLQAEKEKLQAEKEKLQAEKETFELEKRKLALEIQSLELKDKYTN